MSVFSRISKGWSMGKTSLQILNENRYLLLFPAISSLALIAILATFFGSAFYFIGDQVEYYLDLLDQNEYLVYGVIFLYYLVNFFIIVFFNSALIHCVLKIFNGEETSLSDGLQFASSRSHKILGWAAVSATMGTLFQALNNTGRIGGIVSSLIGVAWSVLTFFVLPVIVYEDIGVIESVKKSGRMMKEKWGESIGANVNFNIFFLIAFLFAIAVGVSFSIVIHPAVGIPLGVAIILISTTILAAAKMVFVAAVYNHAVGLPTGQFDSSTLDTAFIYKKRKKFF